MERNQYITKVLYEFNINIKFFLFDVEKVRDNFVCIRMNPLTENKDIKKKQGILKKLCPKAVLKFEGLVNSLLQYFFNLLKGRFLFTKK